MSVEIYSSGTLVSSGQTINNAKIENPSSMYVYDGGIANSAIVTSHGRMYIEEGGIANSAIVTYGAMYIEDGGIAYDTVVQSGGTANVATGGKIKNTVVSASADSNGMIMGSAVVNVSGIAENTVLQGVLVSNMGGMSGTAVMNIGSGGKAVDTTVNSRGAFYVSGSAENTTVNSGGYFYVSGNIKNTTVNSGGNIHFGALTMPDSNIVVDDLYLKKGGLLNGKFSFGEDRYFDSIEFVKSENGTGWFLNDNLLLIDAGGPTSNVGLHVFRGTVDNITVTGGNNTYGTHMSTEGFIISAGAVANNTVNVYGTMDVYGTANDTVVYGRAVSGVMAGMLSTYYGVVNVYDGGIINDTLVEEYGKVVVSSGGTVNNISVMSGGDVSFSDGAILRGVNNIAGSINNNTMGMGMLNAVDAEGAVINFALNELSAAHAATNDTAGTTVPGIPAAIICDSLNKFTGAEFTITVNANQAKGYYNLSSFTGGDSSSFLYDGEMTITVGDYSEALSVGDSLIYDGIEYTLQYAGSLATKLQLMVNYEGSEGFYMPTSGSSIASASYLSDCTVLNHKLSCSVSSGSNLYLEGSATIYDARDIKVYNGGMLRINGSSIYTPGIISYFEGHGSNIDVYSGGELEVAWSASVTDVVIHSGGTMALVRFDDESSQYASNVKIEHGGKMFIQGDGEVTDVEIAGYAKVKEDGTLRDSIVENGGLTYVMDDGYAENITVNAEGNFYVAMGGYAENITINGGNVHIATGGMISDVNIDSGNLFLYGGAVIDGTINLNGTVVLDDIAYNNGVINIMISKESVSTPMINDMSRLDGGELNVSVENAGVGEYIIAGNAGNFNSSISVTGVNGENVGDLSVGDSVTVNSVDYSLVKELDRLIVKANAVPVVITVDENLPKDYYDLASLPGGEGIDFTYVDTVTVKVGDYSAELSVGESFVRNGIEYTLQSPGTGSMRLMVNYEGSEGFYMPTGGIYAPVSSLSDCTVLNHTLPSFIVVSGSNLYLEGSAIIYDARDIKVYNGGILRINSGYYSNGAIASYFDGYGSNIDVYSGGKLNVAYSVSVTDVVIHSGGTMALTDYEGIASNVKIEHGGKMFIEHDGGEVTDAEIAGYATVESDGVLKDSTVENGGTTFVLARGYAENITVNADGNFYVAMGGYAENITINGGNVHIATGGMISDVNIDSGNLFLYGGAVIDGTINLNGTVVLDDIAYNNGVINIMISKES
ncbi:MAG: hypothetical protein IKA22_03375, partial [Lentisphaeria bacterium]|nr:hypothetical protein [Lentisphaeria bacterium]